MCMIILDYIKNEKWFQGVRAEVSLLMFSLKVEGQRELMKKSYGIDFIECLLCPSKKNILIRIFNLTQAKEFHSYSLKQIKKDENIIKVFLKKDKLLWKEIILLCNKLKESCKKNDSGNAKDLFVEICEKYKEYGVHFFVLFSLGMKLTEVGAKGKSLLKMHDKWRNSVVFGEEKLGEAIWYFLQFYLGVKNPKDFMGYLTYEELLKSLGDKKGVNKLISKRKKDDYIFLGLRKKSEVIDDVRTIEDVSTHFNELFEKKVISDLIEGRVTYASDEIINGEVVLVKNKEELKGNYKGKILVAIQTTPHFVPYLNGVKAIITDEGGVTSHAAIISREFKIPTVVGTQIATKVLKTGDIVEITFKEGKVKKIK